MQAARIPSSFDSRQQDVTSDQNTTDFELSHVDSNKIMMRVGRRGWRRALQVNISGLRPVSLPQGETIPRLKFFLGLALTIHDRSRDSYMIVVAIHT